MLMKQKKYPKNKSVLYFFLALAILFFVSGSGIALAAGYIYTPMEKIPGFGQDASDKPFSDFPNYILSITKFVIWTVGIAALLMIIIGGFMYITSAGNTSRTETAKTVIFDALYGLLVALAAWLLLYVINPDLVRVNISMKPVAALPPVVSVKPPAGVTFNNMASLELSTFITCMTSKIPSIRITSVTDTNIQKGFCNPTTDPDEKFRDSNNCQHSQYSCHYGGRNGSCIAKGSYAIDIGLDTDGKKVLEAAVSCSQAKGSTDMAKCLINESGTHHHVSIGAYYGCGCDTFMRTCSSVSL